MTAPIRLTLPGPAVTADVTWDDVRRHLVAEGWREVAPGVWFRGGHTSVRSRGDDDDMAFTVRRLARLADVAPGVMLARIAAPTPQLADLDGMADQFRATTRALTFPLSHADQIYTDVTGRQKAQHEATGGVPALPLGEYEQGFVQQGEKDMRARAAEAADAEVEIAHPIGAVAARHIAAAIRALPLGGDR